MSGIENNKRNMTTLGGSRVVEGRQNSVEIENLARFAVQEHNKKQNALLEFVKVISAKTQVVSGTLYDITLEATGGGRTKVYETKVLEKLWLNFKEVQEFKLLAHAPSASTT
ncbi:hypothetical protein Lal_00048654 [Lupinus albus]|uniref:Cysteine proteinase inhibitor n=1 Tax=Lupinus albus TaxID=3870 RepID=A0A6A5LTK4_LUPAL|nr:putative Cystatin domain-containing protein [Lupinus albus]KAF1864089.1 hypothetical protein Lal_00048654 [Lupinus albus]